MESTSRWVFVFILVLGCSSKTLHGTHEKETPDIRKYVNTSERTWVYYKNYPDTVYKTPRPCLYDKTVTVSTYDCRYNEYWGTQKPRYQQTLNGMFLDVCDGEFAYPSMRVQDEKTGLYVTYTLFFVDEDDCSIMFVNVSPEALSQKILCERIKAGTRLSLSGRGGNYARSANCEMRLRERSLNDGPGETCRNVYGWACGEKQIKVYDPNCVSAVKQYQENLCEVQEAENKKIGD